MRYAAWVLGFHGCDRKVGEAILRGGTEVRVSRNLHDWLGSGAYFWENSPSRAREWATYLQKNPQLPGPRIREPFVIGSIIDPGHCLDLTDIDSTRELATAYDKFVESVKMAGLPLPQNESSHSRDEDLVKRKLDCAVINSLHGMRAQSGLPPFDSVRAPFMEGAPLFEGSKLHAKTHIQWCVRNPARSIIAYFRPRKATFG
jgi:hypothetical protein